MNAMQAKTSAAMLLPAVATLLFVQACGGGGWARADEPVDPYVGVWEATVVARDCGSGAELGRFLGAQAVHEGGTLSDTNASPSSSRGPGMGVWTRVGEGRYAVKFRFYRYNPDGSLAGTTVVNSSRTLSTDGQSYEGDTRSEVRDVAGRVLSTTCVVDKGTRFQ